jgi:hypothetical protein
MREYFIYLMIVLPGWFLAWFITNDWTRDKEHKQYQKTKKGGRK